jgi:hypothetical protein
VSGPQFVIVQESVAVAVGILAALGMFVGGRRCAWVARKGARRAWRIEWMGREGSLYMITPDWRKKPRLGVQMRLTGKKREELEAWVAFRCT